MSSVRVLLDNGGDACYPGQTIAGRVECNFNEETKLRAVKIKFKGRAKTDWSVSVSYGTGKDRRTTRVRYFGEEIYFDAQYNLVQGDENFTLPAGNHIYPFSYILPSQIPSCFEGLFGNIRYYIKATVDRPWKLDYEERIGLNLVSPLDLNYLPQLRDPVNIAVDKTMCSCWCNASGGLLTLKMSLPVTGFVSGQEINIACHIENLTNVNAESVKFKIIELTEFISHYPSTRTNYQEGTVAECKEGGIGAHSEKSWTTSIKLPAVHIPNLNPCSIINISYALQAEVVVPCPHTNLDSYIPITIGTVPLSDIANTSFPPGGPLPTISYPLPSGNISATITPLQGAPAHPYPTTFIANSPSGIDPYAFGGSGPSPYPLGGSTPYVPAGSAPIPIGLNISYPPGYPSSGSSPYPIGGITPYPPGGTASISSGDTKYPPVPYPSTVTNSFGEKDPSAPPCPSEGALRAPYPSGGAPYPPNIGINS